MTELVQVTKTGIQSLVIFVLIFFLGLQLQGLSLEPNVSPAYVQFYSGLIILGIASVIGAAFFKIQYLDQFEIPFAVKAGVTVFWVVLIILVSFSGTQVVPVPRASIETFQLTEGTELYLSSFVPGVLEDQVYLIGFPMILSVIIFLFLEYGLKIEIGSGAMVGVLIFSAFVASIGYNVFVIPGFASAHVPSYGASNPGLFAAFFFGFGQSLVYLFTGWFIPAAHNIHNVIIFWSAQVGLNIGPLSISGVQT